MLPGDRSTRDSVDFNILRQRSDFQLNGNVLRLTCGDLKTGLSRGRETRGLDTQVVTSSGQIGNGEMALIISDGALHEFRRFVLNDDGCILYRTSATIRHGSRNG